MPPRSATLEMGRALARAERGSALTLEETTTLLGARRDDLQRLLATASRLRDLGHGDTITYSPKVFVPLTMLCRDHCHYCTFAKPPAKLDAPFLTPEQAVA
ncbi:MAG TPA: 7,8-didemethyl-8-hydroxy-5-deazariboflavin synthase, partial [Actinomycetota bacterium]|nr:7,8-didemethyl-8-hydroxy-5-deazariboflavin synthase [Actinomycetota bacterium]